MEEGSKIEKELEDGRGAWKPLALEEATPDSEPPESFPEFELDNETELSRLTFEEQQLVDNIRSALFQLQQAKSRVKKEIEANFESPGAPVTPSLGEPESRKQMGTAPLRSDRKRPLVFYEATQSHWQAEAMGQQSDDISVAVDSLVGEIVLERSDGSSLRETVRSTLTSWLSRGSEDFFTRMRRERDSSARSGRSARPDDKSRSPGRGGRE